MFACRYSSLRYALVTCLLVCCQGAGAAQAPGFDGPLRVRNVSPVMQLYGTPRMSGARVLRDGWETTFGFEVGNIFHSEDRAGTFAFFDGETYVASYRLRGHLRGPLEWGIELPYVAHTGGGLDAIIDEFHEAFGLPDGMRDVASRDQLDFLIESDGVVYADFTDSKRALGDVRLFGGVQLIDEPDTALALRGLIKLPTGELTDLSGSEATDVSVWLEAQRDFAFAWPLSLTLGAGTAYLGRGELIPHRQRRWVAVGHLGLHWRISERILLQGQLDAHDQVIDTGNPLVADTGILGTLGARVDVTPRLWMDLGLIEDLDAKSGSDVVFQLLLGARL